MNAHPHTHTEMSVRIRGWVYAPHFTVFAERMVQGRLGFIKVKMITFQVFCSETGEQSVGTMYILYQGVRIGVNVSSNKRHSLQYFG